MTKKKIPTATSRRPVTFKPRFNFSAEFPSAPGEYATIGDLLLELSHELYPSDGIRVDGKPLKMMKIKDIETSLRFFRKLFGFRLKSVTESYPIEAIKTFKAIYNCNRNYNKGIIGWIEPLSDSDDSLIDILMAPRNRINAPLFDCVQRALDTIGLEIDFDEKHGIDAMADPTGLRAWIEELHTREIEDVLKAHLPTHDPLYEYADAYFSTAILMFADRVRDTPKEPRVHVAVYAYLRCLHLIHWLHFEIKRNLSFEGDKFVSNLHVDFSELCAKVSKAIEGTIRSDTPFLSLPETVAFAKDHASDIAKLTSEATGHQYNRRDIENDHERAGIVLKLYADAAQLHEPKFQRPFGITHVVASYCSVLHQRKIGSKPANRNRSLGEHLLIPQKHLDNHIAKRNRWLPYSTAALYCDRAKWYIAALHGRKNASDNHDKLKYARRQLCDALVTTLDSLRIRQLLAIHGDEMRALAQEFLRQHGRLEDVYITVAS